MIFREYIKGLTKEELSKQSEDGISVLEYKFYEWRNKYYNDSKLHNDMLRLISKKGNIDESGNITINIEQLLGIIYNTVSDMIEFTTNISKMDLDKENKIRNYIGLKEI